MAYLPAISTAIAGTTTADPNTLSSCHINPTSSPQLFISKRRRNHHHHLRGRLPLAPKVSCRARESEDAVDDDPLFPSRLDRRNVLLGLGGVALGAATPTTTAGTGGVAKAAQARAATPVSFPVYLTEAIKVEVARPKKGRSKKEKEDEEEVLLIEGIKFDREKFVKFDVYVNEDEGVARRPGNSEFAGSFVNVPHKHEQGQATLKKTRLRLVVTDLLEDLEAEDDDTVGVAIVPRSNGDSVSISGIKIEYVS